MQIKCLDMMKKFYKVYEFKKLIGLNGIVDFGVNRNHNSNFFVYEKLGLLMKLKNDILNIVVYKSWENESYLMLEGPNLGDFKYIPKEYDDYEIHLTIIYLSKKEYETEEDPEVITGIINSLFNTHYYSKEIINGDMRRLEDSSVPNSWNLRAIESSGKVSKSILELIGDFM